MTPKHKIFIAILFFSQLGFPNVPLFAQSSGVKDLVSEGVKFHDGGNYEMAVVKYHQALELDSTSSLANYEIAYTYYALKDYELAKKHCLEVMKGYSDEYLNAALIYGSIMDDLGNPGEAIKFYKKLLKTYPKADLVHYNIAISYTKISRFKKAEEHFAAAIINNLSRASSHLALGELMYNKKRHIESLLPLYFFLLIEPGSERSAHALELLFAQLSGDSDKKDKDSVQADLYKPYDMQFNAENMIISMNATLKEGQSEFTWFYTITKSLFESLADNYLMKPGIWRDVYVPIFADLVYSEHFGPYCHYIIQNKYPTSKEWVIEHPYMVDDMFKFINN